MFLKNYLRNSKNAVLQEVVFDLTNEMFLISTSVELAF